MQKKFGWLIRNLSSICAFPRNFNGTFPGVDPKLIPFKYEKGIEQSQRSQILQEGKMIKPF